MRLTWTKAFLVLVLAAVAYVAYAGWRNDRTQAGFEAVTEGMSKQEVLALLGPPGWENDGCRDLPPAVCAAEFQYDELLMPAFWTVSFDDGNNVIHKYHYVSP